MVGWIVFSMFFFTVLTMVWIKGLGVVKRTQPEKAVTFYFIMAAIRFLMSLTVVLLFLLFATRTHEETVIFCVTFCVMYVAMVITSIALKH